MSVYSFFMSVLFERINVLNNELETQLREESALKFVFEADSRNNGLCFKGTSKLSFRVHVRSFFGFIIEERYVNVHPGRSMQAGSQCNSCTVCIRAFGSYISIFHRAEVIIPACPECNAAA